MERFSALPEDWAVIEHVQAEKGAEAEMDEASKKAFSSQYPNMFEEDTFELSDGTEIVLSDDTHTAA